jgi:hypothetical protein
VPRGGKQPGAGRKPKLPLSEQEELAREFHGRMEAWAAARALRRDPDIQERRDIDRKARQKAYATKRLSNPPPPPKERDEDVIWYYGQIAPEVKKLLAKRDAIPNRAIVSLKRAMGGRARIIADLAKEYEISKRTAVDYINKFEFRK